MTTTALTVARPDARSTAWLDRQLYPFAARYIELDGQRLHYIDEGTGPTVLFVHGTPSWSFEWREQVKALSGRFRCIALDHLGFGLSDKPEHAAYKPEDHARRLASFVRALDLRDVTLVVHDFGGPIGVGAALEDRARFKRLVVMNTWLWSMAEEPSVRKISGFVRSFLGRFLYRFLNFSPRVLVPGSFAVKQRLSPTVHRHYLAPFATRRERTAPWVLGCELAGSDQFYSSLWQRRAQWPELAAIIWGMRDPMIKPSLLTQLETAYPRVPITRIADAGHFPQEEEPQTVTTAIEQALT